MTNTVVAYATAHGTTQSIAQRIAEIVGGKGDDVELRALDERSGLGDLAEVDYLIIGSAIHKRAMASRRRGRGSRFSAAPRSPCGMGILGLLGGSNQLFSGPAGSTRPSSRHFRAACSHRAEDPGRRQIASLLRRRNRTRRLAQDRTDPVPSHGRPIRRCSRLG
ncbi:flavodoxin domain-containing protein [Williamsia muralis]|uniref:flavodoxin domain-containing protein n=1 Tax=Williamsia marianensis TaxID=85044 RepID=UPI003F5CC8CA